MSIEELHINMVSTSSEVRLKEIRDADNNIIIIDTTLRKILLTQLKKMYARYKVMYGCECFIYPKIMH